MFQILVVEDTTDKLKNIIQTLEGISEIDPDFIDSVIDANDAKKKIVEKKYDLLILDISIPLRKSQEVDPYGGLTLLEEVLNRSKYNIPIHIIGLTAHDEVFERAKEQLSKNILTLIRYRESDDEWKTQLTNGVRQRLSAKLAPDSLELKYDYDVAIICALKLELEGNKGNGWDWSIFSVLGDDTIYYRATFSNSTGKTFNAIAASATRMGMPFCASLAMKVCIKFRPRFLVMTGIMAGLKGKVNLGDIIAANPVWDWGSGKWIPNIKKGKTEKSITGEMTLNVNPYKSSIDLSPVISKEEASKKDSLFQIDPYQYNLDSEILREVTMLSEDENFLFQLRKQSIKKAPTYDITIKDGPVASGAAVLSDISFIERIKEEQHRKLMGVEMEAYALFCAAESAPRPKPKPVCIKTVVDFGDVEKSDDYQDFGCYASAIVAKKIVEKLLEK